jgi:hypothetical protein
VFNYATKDFNEAQKSQINSYRLNLNDDALLIRFMRSSNVNPSMTLSVINDLRSNNIPFEIEEGGLIKMGENSWMNLKQMRNVPDPNRLSFGGIRASVANLNERDAAAFSQLRAKFDNKAQLLLTIYAYGDQNGANSDQSVRSVLTAWNNWQRSHGTVGNNQNVPVRFTPQGQMVVAESHVFNINQVALFDSSLVQVMRSALGGLNGKFNQIKLTFYL